MVFSPIPYFREYLSQRHYSSVLYLNGPSEASNDECNMADGFTGGDLCFKDDTPEGGQFVSRLTPRAGRLVAYSSDSHNMHQVSVCVCEDLQIAYGHTAHVRGYRRSLRPGWVAK